jgi:hypothetical protein
MSPNKIWNKQRPCLWFRACRWFFSADDGTATSVVKYGEALNAIMPSYILGRNWHHMPPYKRLIAQGLGNADRWIPFLYLQTVTPLVCTYDMTSISDTSLFCSAPAGPSSARAFSRVEVMLLCYILWEGSVDNWQVSLEAAWNFLWYLLSWWKSHSWKCRDVKEKKVVCPWMENLTNRVIWATKSPSKDNMHRCLW